VYTVTRVLHAMDPCRGGDVCRTRVLPHRVPTRVDGRVHTFNAPTRVLWPNTRLAKFRDERRLHWAMRNSVGLTLAFKLSCNLSQYVTAW
jgi:hypothetical protein